jgi:hypothetical protein
MSGAGFMSFGTREGHKHSGQILGHARIVASRKWRVGVVLSHPFRDKTAERMGRTRFVLGSESKIKVVTGIEA